MSLLRVGRRVARCLVHPVVRRPGVTLVELMVALSLFSILLVTTLSFYHRQSGAFTEGNVRMAVMQNLRYGVSTLVQNVRTAGVGVPTKQPVLVYAGATVLAFNADYATNLENDFFAVYHDPRLPQEAVSALDPDRQITLPGTTFQYPAERYFLGSGNSPAETIIFYFAPDDETARPDDYVLYRQVNDQPADVVTRRLLKTDEAFFAYYTAAEGTPVAEVPSEDLPLAHAVPVHGSPADVGEVAAIDSIVAVRVTYAATNGLTGSHESVREITRLIRLPNAGLANQPNCGARPILGNTLNVQGQSPAGSVAGHIQLTWGPAVDELSGERDVLRYVLWRRLGSSGEWGDPLTSVPPGASSYIYRDFGALPDSAYSYALAAQDCTPQYSPMSTTPTAEWIE